MHEMSLCESVLQLIEQQAVSQNYHRVKTVWLEIGTLAGVELEAMRFCFDAVTRTSLAEGARLEIIEVPGQGHCLSCGKTVSVVRRYDACPECGGYPLRVTDGEQLRVKELEVE